MHYNAFFRKWVYDMLHDSVEWRKQLGNCINDAKSQNCKNNKCNRECGCFEKWVEQKQQEWKKIKEHFDKQKDLPPCLSHYKLLELLLEKKELLKSIKEAYGDTDDIKHIKQLLNDKAAVAGVLGGGDASGPGGACTEGPVAEKDTTIDKLLKHEEGIAEKCVENNPPEKCQPKKLKNPCSGDKKYDMLAEKVAETLQGKAQTQLDRNDSRNALRSDASKGQYNGRNSGNDLEENICSIDQTYSNAGNDESKNPCNGKGDGFKIGTEWPNIEGKKQTSYTDVYLPPRRQHMCTSNLEHLNTGNNGLSNSSIASNSLLGDVLLAAKEEAEDIKNKAKGKDAKNGLTDDQTVCRAIRYSFADIGDIIRGRDMWDKDKGARDMEDHLKKIFGKIKEEIKKKHLGIKGNDKYVKDNENKQLRSDWWEANRDQIWKAMQCKTSPSVTTNCDKQPTPYDDYIPQRLRWMTEWAEWYCKEQSRLYGELMVACGRCKEKGSGKECMNGSVECKKCKPACEEYKKEIDKWKKQWEQMQIPYVILYYEAQRNSDGMVLVGTYPDYKQVVEFFKKLKETIKSSALNRPKRSTDAITTDPTTPYSSAAGYIHQEARTGLCLEQREFCDKKNGIDNTSYAFKDPPHGYDKACKCDTRNQQTDGAPGRAEIPEDERTPRPDSDVEEEDESEASDEDDEDEDEGEEQPEPVENTEKEVPSPPKKEDTTSLDVCETVKNALTIDTLKQACNLKYSGNNSRLGWKCIPSGNDKATGGAVTAPGDKGAICIPPRRRRLYVGKLETLDTDSTSQNDVKTPSKPDKTASQDPSDKLREAFIQSAAIETFFLWDRYKKEWEQRNKSQNEVGGAAGGLQPPDGTLGDDKDKDPQKELQESGKIPDGFLRLMFYTLGDYRDILFGDKEVIETLKKSGDKNIDKIEQKIKSVIEKSDSTSPRTPPVPPKTDSEKPRKTLWDRIAPSIWKGMVCALSYDTTNISMNPEVHKHLTTNNNNNYKDVTISSVDPSGDTKLDDFAKRPTFFRWLEEWGEEFCRKQRHKLKNLEKQCRGVNNSGNEKYCSGDGYHCNDDDLKHNKMFTRLNCGDCEKECTNYRKWIQKKVQEFDKHKNKYGNEIEKLKTDSSKNAHDKMFYELINEKNNYTCAEEFLASLNNCKNGEHDKNQTNKIDFKNLHKTFGPSTYCKACPIYGVNCDARGPSRGRSATNGCTKNTEPTNNEMHVVGDSTPIDILINDGATKETNNELQEKCKEYGLYKNLKKQKWKCQNINNIYKCELQKPLNSEYYDDNIPFKILFERWLRDFVEGYNKSKERITRCTNDKTSCKQGCKGNCVCVEEWLKIKEEEWNIIKQYYKQNFQSDDEPIDSNIKGFFEHGTFSSDAEEAKKVVDEENKRDELWGCTGRNDCESKEEREKYGEFITNLIKKLKEKIGKCKTQHSDKTQPCDEIPPHSDETLEEQTDDDTTDNQSPAFCPPPEPPMTCVEKIAKELRVEAEVNANKYDSSLKGKGKDFKSECNKVKKENGTSQEDLCKFDKTYKNSLNNMDKQCELKGMDRLMLGKTWNSKYISKVGKVLYIPPRREHMCLDALNTLGRLTINDSSALLKKVQEAAKREGDDIIKKLLEQNSCDEHRICDAMKYSFADIGDIIRGRDLLNKNNKQKGIQKKIENTFENIYIKLERDKSKYANDRQKYLKLRSDWWDANRKAIWNAMTCNAPKDAKLNKRNEEPEGTSTSGSFVSTLDNCGYEKDPPDYDYIPQPFRWMQEWSEYYCKLLNKEMEQFENICAECKNNGVSCKDDINGNKCKKCKEQCKNYNTLIHKSILEFDKYKETYNELYKNNTKAKISSEKHFKNFLEKLKDQCKDKNSADKYLDEASHCKKYKFTNSNNKNNDNYAFKNPPKDFEQACRCDAPDPLDECPNNKENKGACKKLSIENECKNKNLNNDDGWSAQEVKESTGKNNGVLVPPRRRHLCLRNITSNTKSINNKKIFKNKLLKSAYSEGYYLWDKYKHDSTTLLDVMRYSFYDYGDIVKGTDMMDNYLLKQLKTTIDQLLKDPHNDDASSYREKWWEANKTHVWHAMICGYQERNGYNSINASWCSVPTHDEKTHQFLRWFREWTESFCIQRKKLYDIMVNNCKEAECDKNTGKVNLSECTQACREYENYVSKKKNEYFSQKVKYDKDFKASNNKNDAPRYFKYSTYFNKYDCLYDHFNNDNNWKNPYDSFDDPKHKEKCQCIQSIISIERKKKEEPKEPVQPPKKPEVEPPQADEPFNRDILEKTIPFGIALALGSIAFLFLK
ncbi:hypothetical protein PFMALIP_06029, partial [Plasmodium falciparum MaliPS096_E11]